MEIELSSGVETLVKRMQTNPEEFFGDAKRWSFIFREHFRDVMTEAEKGAIHQGMKEVRRIEFDVMVVKELLREEQEQEQEKEKWVHPQGTTSISTQAFGQAITTGTGVTKGGPFGAVPKASGQRVI